MFLLTVKQLIHSLTTLKEDVIHSKTFYPWKLVQFKTVSAVVAKILTSEWNVTDQLPCFVDIGFFSLKFDNQRVGSLLELGLLIKANFRFLETRKTYGMDKIIWGVNPISGHVPISSMFPFTEIIRLPIHAFIVYEFHVKYVQMRITK